MGGSKTGRISMTERQHVLWLLSLSQDQAAFEQLSEDDREWLLSLYEYEYEQLELYRAAHSAERT
jgi:hypothetical protein